MDETLVNEPVVVFAKVLNLIIPLEVWPAWERKVISGQDLDTTLRYVGLHQRSKVKLQFFEF